MPRFSDRIGATRPPELAREHAPNELRIALWNLFQPLLFDGERSYWYPRLEYVYRFLHWPTHKMSYHQPYVVQELEQWFFSCTWYDVYNLSEFIANLLARTKTRVYESFNQVLQMEGSPYRFVDSQLTMITDETELAAVREALTSEGPFAGARKHLSDALELLGRRPEPDFRNTIKEAISAVESTLKVLTGHDHADLAEALREYARSNPIHGALFRGLDSLYGYTSNEHGLRHALLAADANVGFAEAKFMVVACSAFVSYLISRKAS
jgi:hypothetical protein